MKTQSTDPFDLYLREIRRTPLLSADEELAAAKEVVRTRRRLTASSAPRWGR